MQNLLSPVKQALLEQRLKGIAATQSKSPELIPARPDPESAPLSFAQRQIWLIDQMAPGNPAYNLPYGYRLRGVLDLVALEQSFNQIIARHESLRTTVAVEDGEPFQRIHPTLKIKLNFTALDHLNQEEREKAAQVLASEESLKSFDLSRLPLIRVSVFKLDDAEHVLITNIHHIVADGLSMGVLWKELDNFYRAFTEGREPALAKLAVQYGDFACWQRDIITDEAASARQIEFWRKQLGGTLPVLQLPADKPRPAFQSFQGSNVFFNIPITQVRELKSLAAREGCTFFMTVLAAFQVLLHRYSGAEDMVIGMPIADRGPGELDPLIGLFLNMVGLRCDLSDDPTFIELLRKSRDTTLNAFSNGALPLEVLMKYLKVERDPSRNPIFQVALQVLSTKPSNLGDLEVSNFYFDLKFAQFDLTLHLYEEAGGYQGRFEYCTDLFNRETIERLSQHFLRLLEAVTSDSEERISKLPMLTDTERHQVLEVWNQTGVAYPAPRCVHELIEEQARIRPDALAAESDGRKLNYQKLDESAERLAERLRKHGVRPNSLVATCLDRSIEMLVGLLAVWKVGGAYVPIDPDYPAERVRFMLDDTGAVVVLTQKSLSAALPVTNAAILYIDDEEDDVGSNSPDRSDDGASSPEQLAYVIYTSGSTGRPKGVPITHANLFNLICWHQQAYAVTAADRATQVAGPAFDAAVWEIWPYLTAGASVHIPDDATRLDAGRLVRWLADQQITLTFLPTPLAESALRESWPETIALRALLTGGDRLNQRPARKLPFRLINHYGPTENTVVSTCGDVAEGISKSAPTIGRPLPNTQAYIVDRHLQPVPIGVPGELLLGGAQLTSGYWNQRELTAEKFIANPFRSELARLYRTGDLVRFLPDASIEFLGRIDNQVKIRGFRIELGEIESVLGQHPSIRQVAVLAREDPPGHKCLVAYIVAENTPVDLLDELRSRLRATLPEYMVPASFVLLEAFPLTPNGKIDRNQLPAPERSASQVAYVAPRTPAEKVLTRIWSEILGIERVGVEDNFFELGGNSLLAMRFVSRVRQALAVELPLRDLFALPTISQVAARIQHLHVGPGPGLSIPPLESADDSGAAELSFSQQRLWFLDQIEPQGTAYIIPAAFDLRGALDVPTLECALRSLVSRHESLRTVFVKADGRPQQVVSKPGTWTLPVLDLSGEAHPREQLITILRTEASRGFDLARGPLFRAQLYRLAPDTHVLLLVMHHIISDGWSMGILIRELGELYHSFSQGEAPTLPALRIQYRDFARWQRNWLKDEALERLLSHWRTRLAGAPQVLELPTDRHRPAIERHLGAIYSFTLPIELTDALRRFAQHEGATLYMTLLSAFAVLLSRYSGQEDLLIGTPVANRNHPDIENVVGFFINTLVLRADLSGDLSAKDFLSRMREVCLDAFAHQELPFERLVEEMRPARDLARSPLVQVMFALQNAPLHPLEFPDVTALPLDVDPRAAQFDLTLQVEDTAQGLTGSFEYATDLFEEPTIARMATHWRSLLEALVAAPERRITELPLLTEPERRQLLVEWNQTAAEYPNSCIHQLFEKQVERTPDSIVVISGNQRLTYAELNRRSNQLAHHLKTAGIGPETLVAVLLDRSVDMLTAILGILKSGGAYVPLDPNYPKKRVATILKDAKPMIVLTQESLANSLPAFTAQVIALDADWPQIASQPQANLSTPVTPEHLAYVLFTSGSTGRPKGVALEHRSAVAFIDWARQVFSPRELAGVLFSTSICFDLSVFEMFLTLSAGGKIILAQNALDLPAVPAKEEVTLINTVPSAMAELLRSGAVPHSVKTVNLAGEALPPSLVDEIYTSTGVEKVYNLYGPTETTTYSTFTLVRPGCPVTIGKPIAGTQCYILDARRDPSPIGVIGELYIAGGGLARGYYNSPELTNERFVPNPFGQGRMYRTGDLCRWLRDGNIQFCGRADQQVKLRGFRIELGEIESAIAQHLAVHEVAVVVREDTPGNKRLVAYLAVENSPADLVDELRALLRSALPEYMMPAQFVLLDALPRTPNDKLDRNALPVPEESGCSTRAYEPPVSEIEITLAQIWCDVLKLKRVGRNDQFFDLGGHSLLAVSLIERMRQNGLHADVRALFATPTLVDLAAAITRERSVVEVPPNRIPPGCDAITPEMLPLVQLTSDDIEQIVRLVPRGAANMQDIYPLAPTQEGILFHHQIATEGDPYLLSAWFSFDTRDRMEGYIDALQAVVNRHDILRTSVLWEGLPEPVQVVWRQAPFRVEELDLEPGAGDAIEQLRARIDPRHYRLDVREAPMLRVFIAHDPPNSRWVMLQLFHHLSMDHTTLEIMQREIQAHLLGQTSDLAASLPFRNFVAQARSDLSRKEDEAFFHGLLGDVDEPTAPFGLLDVHGDGFDIAEAQSALDATLARRLRERARALGVSAASLCHLAWAQVLARVSARDDVVFGTLLLGRMQGGAGADSALGIFMNTLPVRIRIGDESAEHSVRHTHALLGELLHHERAPLVLAQRCSAVTPPAPLFSALLNYRHSTALNQSFIGASKAAEGIELLGAEERTNYPLVLSVDDLGEGFALKVQVQPPIDPQRICALMHAAAEQLVEALENTPAAPLRRLDVLPELERRQLLVEWNQTAAKYPNCCIHQLFETQVERTPDSIAAISGKQHLTYAELNRRSDQLADHFRALGIGPDVLVGICVERSLEMLVAVFAVLKAGAAYLPLDPTHPKERLAFMIEDSRAAVVLTQTNLTAGLEGVGVKLVILDAPLPVTDGGLDPRSVPAGSFALPGKHQPMLDGAVVSNGRTVRPEDRAYIIYTSGSTGRPKGVVIPHRAVVNFLNSMGRQPGLSASDVLVAVTTLSFDIAVLELQLPLMLGAAVVIATRDEVLDGHALSSLLERSHATVMQATPVTWRLLLQAGWSPNPGFKALVGGETMPKDLADQLISSGVELWNMYGPTETTVWSACTRISDTSNGITIGKPIDNTIIRILDARNNLCPIGVSGELCIGGHGVAIGYWQRPELTAERFIADPFSTDPKSRLYRTGDLARWRNDGTIDHLGRLDFQVKIRGFRIELGEIEAVLTRHPAVREAAVLAREDVPGEKRLVAYVVAENAPPDLTNQFRALIRSTLPEYMLPAEFVALQALPRTPNGKLDRKALPVPSFEDQFPPGVAVPPQTPTEEMVLGVFRLVLNRNDFGIFDNFFDLGGHSLMAARLMSGLRSASGVDLPLRDLFARPTVAGLAEAIDARQWLQRSGSPAPNSDVREEIVL